MDGKLLKLAREVLGITEEELGQALGRSHTAVYRWGLGQTVPHWAVPMIRAFLRDRIRVKRASLSFIARWLREDEKSEKH